MPNSEIVPATKPEVSEDEQKFRDSLYPKVKTIKDRNVLCTSCNSSVKELILKGKPAVHPFMETLLCEKCHSFFGDGEFSVDEDGSDKYCRWCGQGGTLFLCSTCNAGFCKKCIKRNLPRSALAEVEKDDWLCYCCNVKPLYELRAHCWAALKYSETIKPKEEAAPNKKRKHRSEGSNNEEESDNDEEKPKKKRSSRRTLDESRSSKSSRNKSSLNKTKGSDDDGVEIKDSEDENKEEEETKKEKDEAKRKREKQYRVLVNKYCDMLDDTIKVAELLKRKCSDYKTRRVKVKTFDGVERVEEFLVKFETLSKSAEDSIQKLRTGMKEYTEEWKKALKEIEKQTTTKEDKEADESKSLENGLSPKEEEKESEVSKEGANGKTEEEEEEKKEEDKREVVEGAKEEKPEEEEAMEVEASEGSPKENRLEGGGETQEEGGDEEKTTEKKEGEKEVENGEGCGDAQKSSTAADLDTSSSPKKPSSLQTSNTEEETEKSDKPTEVDGSSLA